MTQDHHNGILYGLIILLYLSKGSAAVAVDKLEAGLKQVQEDIQLISACAHRREGASAYFYNQFCPRKD